MCDVDKFGSLDVYKIVNGPVSSEVWKFGSLQNCKLTDKFGSLEVYKDANGPIYLEFWRFGRLQIVCDDDTFGGLEDCILCAMTIGLGVWKSTSLQAYMSCAGVEFGSFEVWGFTHCV